MILNADEALGTTLIIKPMLTKFRKHALTTDYIGYVINAPNIGGVPATALIAGNLPLFGNEELEVPNNRGN
jgi:hypothetical protein